MEHQMDTVYLKEQVGAPLSFAMAAMAIKKPSDPVDFIGRWLLKYVENQTKDEVIQNQIEQRVADAIAATTRRTRRVPSRALMGRLRKPRIRRRTRRMTETRVVFFHL
eukprot:gnl/Hemi2/20921_TR6932_c0_g1_i1.p3 gnl/Hemi2/20921_TR6932_c0_g1~~gnl/Hemi2/20921_TR6932_c0_g1_i1.p3  ORF type:complete len:108 (-),score=7.60 gnl/Hemi2/20921_TR6932_c0_g1_i1:42-365(-)